VDVLKGDHVVGAVAKVGALDREDDIDRVDVAGRGGRRDVAGVASTLEQEVEEGVVGAVGDVRELAGEGDGRVDAGAAAQGAQDTTGLVGIDGAAEGVGLHAGDRQVADRQGDGEGDGGAGAILEGDGAVSEVLDNGAQGHDGLLL
jgi:hypothetical protein